MSAIGSLHKEYGFPSTHSTNSVSIALFLFSILHRLYTTPANLPPAVVSSMPAATIEMAQIIASNASSMSSGEGLISRTTYWISLAALIFYVFTIVYGRIYTGMHSFSDVAFGSLLGAWIWALYIYVEPVIDIWIRENGWMGAYSPLLSRYIAAL